MIAKQALCIATAICLAPVAAVQGQPDVPHIGYVYPAGGQQGSTFQITLGGRNLNGYTAAHFSGEGIQAQFVEYIRPLNQGQFKEMQNRMGELMKKKEAAAPAQSRGRRRGGPQTFTNAQWTAEDEEMLAEIRARLSTFSIRRSSVPALVETVTLQVTVAPDAQPHEQELRLQTAQGLSNPLTFCIGQLPEVTEKSARNIAERESHQRGGRGRKRQQSARPDPGTTPTSAAPEVETDITLPVLVNGQILPGDVDQYRFEARKGQHLVFDVSARSLIPYLSDAVPGWFQATITLYDAAGKEVAYGDDFRFHPDPVLHCEIPEDGEYVIEIRDALYRGREDFVYRMALGELPFITSIFPLGGRSGCQTTLQLSGWNLSQTSLTVSGRNTGLHAVSVLENELSSNHLPCAVDTLPECIEKEPNNEPRAAQRIGFPSITNGRINNAGDFDVFCFEADAGARIVAEVKARRLASSLDSQLKLTTPEGAQLAFNDDYEDKAVGLSTHHADSRLSVTIPTNGLYYLHLADAQSHGGIDYGYRLHLDAQRPDFELRVVPSSINAPAGTSVPMTVHALRRDGFSGDIGLALKTSAPGFRLSGALIPAGQDVTRLTLTVPAESSGEPQILMLEGTATIQQQQITRPAVPADDMMQAFIYRHLVPARELQVTVIPNRRISTMDLLSSEPARIPLGGIVQIPVRIPSRSFFGDINIELDEPPAGIAIEDISTGRRYTQVVLRSDASAVKAGQKGNLIVNVFAVKTGEDSGRGKEQRKKRRILLGTLPAIPFEIVVD